MTSLISMFVLLITVLNLAPKCADHVKYRFR